MLTHRLGSSSLPALLLALVFVVPSLPVGTPTSSPSLGRVPFSSGVASVRPQSAVPVSLSLSGTPQSVDSTFWGTTISAEARLLGDEAALLNATHSKVLVWPGANAGDAVNMLNDTLLKVSGKMLTWKAPETNETQFIDLCRDISCEAIMQVPGEIDNASFAAAEVNFTERTFGFYPSYWEIGNEPELWQDWRVPWNEWNQPPQTGSSVITPSEYAWEVRNYTPILRTADPNIQILGLAGTGRPNGPYPLSTWINATVQVDGPNLAGIAFHVYTAGNTGALTLPQFYAFNTGAYSVAGRVENARSAISNEMNQTCPSCPDPPVFLTELGSALSHYEYDNLSRGFAGGLSMAASELEGLSLGVPAIDVFATIFNTSNSWFDTNGTARPNFTDYAQFLSHLGTEVYPATLQVPTGPEYSGSNSSLSANLFAVGSQAVDGRSDLLLLNENLSSNVSFAPTLPGVPPGTPAELWEWSGQAHFSTTNNTPWVTPLTSFPTATFFPQGIPSDFDLAPQTIALFESYPTAAEPVTFIPSGIPVGTRWYLSVNGTSYETADSSLTVLVPQGNVSLGGEPLSLPYGTFSPNPSKREFGFPPPWIQVGSSPLNVTVHFVAQWLVTWTIVPAGIGTVTPAIGWANASAETNLTALPRGGWVATGWEGSGPGNYTGPGAVAHIHADGPIHEYVIFAAGFNITFVETGLAPGTAWSVRLGADRYTSTGPSFSVLSINGSYVWEGLNVPGYTEGPASGNVTVQGNTVEISIAYTQNATGLNLWWSQNEDRVIAAVFILLAVVLFVVLVNFRDRRKLEQSKPPPPPIAPWPGAAGPPRYRGGNVPPGPRPPTSRS